MLISWGLVDASLLLSHHQGSTPRLIQIYEHHASVDNIATLPKFLTSKRGFALADAVSLSQALQPPQRVPVIQNHVV